MEQQQNRAAWIFVLPALSLIGLFFFVPVLGGLVLSLTDFDIYAIGSPDTARFVAFDNYRKIFADHLFWKALGNTFTNVLIGAPLSVLVSLGAALLVSAKGVRLPALFRSIYFAPVVTTLVAVAIVWRYLYHPKYGLIDMGLGWLGLPPIDWLGDPHWAMPAIILMAVWKNFGYNMIIFIAGLQSVPQELYEAAEVDGANAWQRFRHVTLPSLGPTLLFVGVMTMIGNFQLFAEPYVMTQGGPVRATTSVVLLMYEEGFRWWRMGMAAALAFVLFVITAIGTLIQMRLQRGRG
ncbi:MAG: sugar ABC transporter permease [Candidatus Eisenbacteria bacterium]|nr:sugar ABC transporter permease [Candidatus Eisenbacteria bacterium]MCC7140950.1 sugar ABC transporter permease [Candidatus Eisenbacteria bacterium]